MLESKYVPEEHIMSKLCRVTKYLIAKTKTDARQKISHNFITINV